MWPLRREPTDWELRGYKKVNICGMSFVIKKINPLIDFPPDKIPQIFTDVAVHRQKTPTLTDGIESLRKLQEATYEVIKAGVVTPPLVAEAEKEGIKVSDLFRDPVMGAKLFQEIMLHSLNHFHGLKGLFFFQWTKLLLLIRSLKDIAEHRRRSRLPKVV